MFATRKRLHKLGRLVPPDSQAVRHAQAYTRLDDVTRRLVLERVGELGQLMHHNRLGVARDIFRQLLVAVDGVALLVLVQLGELALAESTKSV